MEIRQALSDVTESERQPPAAVHEANSLIKHMDHFEKALMYVIWKDLVQKMTLSIKLCRSLVLSCAPSSNCMTVS